MLTSYANTNQNYYLDSSCGSHYQNTHFMENNIESPLIIPIDRFEHQDISNWNLHSKYSQSDLNLDKMNALFDIELELNDCIPLKENMKQQIVGDFPHERDKQNQINQEHSNDQIVNQDYQNIQQTSQKNRTNTGSSTNLQHLQDDSFLALQREANQKLAMDRQETNFLKQTNNYFSSNDKSQINKNNFQNDNCKTLEHDIEKIQEENDDENLYGFFSQNEYNNNFTNSQSLIQSQNILSEFNFNNGINNHEDYSNMENFYQQTYQQKNPNLNEINPTQFDYQDIQQNVHNYILIKQNEQSKGSEFEQQQQQINNNNTYAYLKQEYTEQSQTDEQSKNYFNFYENLNSENSQSFNFQEKSQIPKEKSIQRNYIENCGKDQFIIKKEATNYNNQQQYSLGKVYDKYDLEQLDHFNFDLENSYFYYNFNKDFEEEEEQEDGENKLKTKNQSQNKNQDSYNFEDNYYLGYQQKNINENAYQEPKYRVFNQQNQMSNNFQESKNFTSNYQQQNSRNSFGSLQAGEQIIYDSKHSLRKISSNEQYSTTYYQSCLDGFSQQYQQQSQVPCFSQQAQYPVDYVNYNQENQSVQDFNGQSTEKKIFEEIMKLTPKISNYSESTNLILNNNQENNLQKNLFCHEKQVFDSVIPKSFQSNEQEKYNQNLEFPFRKFPIAFELIDDLYNQHQNAIRKQEKLRNQLQTQKHFGFYSLSLLYSFLSFIETIPEQIEQSFLSNKQEDQDTISKFKQLIEQENEKIIELILQKQQNSRKILALSAKVIPVLMQKYQQFCTNILFYAALLIEILYNQRISLYDGCIDQTNYQIVILNLYRLLQNQPIFYQVPVQSKQVEYLIHNIVIVLIGYLNNLDQQFISTLII
ncbi:hypothetical protein ABPG72_016981 [Tetrahymena utriculariae]